MSANVRCANPGSVTLDDGSTLPFCGWKGERLRNAVWGSLLVDQRERQELLTEKPCPRCGGRVELIAEVGEP